MFSLAKKTCRGKTCSSVRGLAVTSIFVPRVQDGCVVSEADGSEIEEEMTATRILAEAMRCELRAAVLAWVPGIRSIVK